MPGLGLGFGLRIGLGLGLVLGRTRCPAASQLEPRARVGDGLHHGTHLIAAPTVLGHSTAQ
eukprot:scaffold65123_cov45-Phaeocystis_antarctica.AAC.1